MPTVLELCGLPIPDGVQGSSLVPLCAGNAAGWPNEAFAAVRAAPFVRQEAYMVGKKRMLRTPEYKLIDYGADFRTQWELFNMADDPAETRNLADDPAYRAVLSALAARLDELQAEKPSPVRVPGMPTQSYVYVPAERRAAMSAAWEANMRRSAARRWQ